LKIKEWANLYCTSSKLGKHDQDLDREQAVNLHWPWLIEIDDLARSDDFTVNLQYCTVQVVELVQIEKGSEDGLTRILQQLYSGTPSVPPVPGRQLLKASRIGAFTLERRTEPESEWVLYSVFFGHCHGHIYLRINITSFPSTPLIQNKKIKGNKDEVQFVDLIDGHPRIAGPDDHGSNYPTSLRPFLYLCRRTGSSESDFSNFEKE
jgi:hypothetical protein